MNCRHCQKKIIGRADKKFCSIQCKNAFHRQVKLKSRNIINEIDAILHRNHAICLELMDTEKKYKLMVPRLVLEKMGFNFNYCTGTYLNHQQKRYHYVYDFSWMEFSSQDIMIIKSTYQRKKT